MLQQPKRYSDLADWWHLLSRVEDYAEEAAIYTQVMKTHAWPHAQEDTDTFTLCNR